MKILERHFHFSRFGTSPRQEIMAGVTTFLTMSYILFVQPALLSRDFAGNPTGLDFNAVLVATCLIAALTSIFMGLYANYPIALAPGMGENFFLYPLSWPLRPRVMTRPGARPWASSSFRAFCFSC